MTIDSLPQTDAITSLMPVRVELFGGLRIRRQDLVVTTIEAGQPSVLMALVCLAQGRAVPREVLAHEIWPEAPSDVARSNLRQCLYRLTADLKQHGLEAMLLRTAASVQLNAGIATDVGEFIASFDEARNAAALPERIAALSRALSLQQHDLLPGHFCDQILAERERLAEMRHTGLRWLSASYLEAGDVPSACEAAISAWRIDPGEDSACQLMRSYAAQGRFGAVRSTYIDLLQQLREDGIDSSSDSTLQLFERLSASEAPPSHFSASDADGMDVRNPVGAGSRSGEDPQYTARHVLPCPPPDEPAVIKKGRTISARIALFAALLAIAPLLLTARMHRLSLAHTRPVRHGTAPAASVSGSPRALGLPHVDLLSDRVGQVVSMPGSEPGSISGSTDALALRWNRWCDLQPGDKGNEPTCVTTDSAGNIYEVGFVDTRKTDVDFLLLKYAPEGRLLWQRRYNGPGNDMDRARSAVVDRLGNLYVTGESDGGKGDGIGNHNGLDIAILKFDPEGNRLWTRRWVGPGNNEDAPVKICLDGDGSVVVTGYSNYGAAPKSSYDWVTLKYSADGRLLWMRRFGGPDDDRPTDMVTDASGNIYVVGSCRQGKNGCAAVKYSSEGQCLWAVALAGTSWRHCALDPSGSLVVCGTDAVAQADSPRYLITTLISDSGHVGWERRICAGYIEQPVGRAIVVTRSGVICVTAACWLPETPMISYILTVAYDAGGNKLWQYGLTGVALGSAYPIALAADDAGNIYEGDVVFNGMESGWHTRQDVVVTRYRQDGAILCTQVYNASLHSDDVLCSMTLDPANNVVLAIFSENQHANAQIANLVKLGAE
jgi:DNA-binding SARP family transcriptional activator